jgi:two-component system cell cycle sensor histidine kinase/response regulator CckA
MQIKQNVNRAANLVRQLLAFSRKQVLKPKVVDITDVLSELSNLLRRLLGENVKLEMKHGRDLGKILADPGQIDQVTINLAVNARDAMPNGGVLTIETSNFRVANEIAIPADLFSPDQDVNFAVGEYVLIKIRDTGTGIPRDILVKIFEPFFSTKEVGAGTGLGLATVYGIVKQTDGHILVRSIEGKGTEFQIYLKRHEATAEETEEARIVEEISNADLTGEGTILLVEDEVPVRIFAARALSNKGYKILEAENAEEALAIIRENSAKIDLVISDVIMPGMTGPEMFKEIQNDNPNLKIIFMSGYTEDAFVGTGLENQDLNFLQKPFNLKDLAEIVKKVISQ